jgi:uncharacterized protein (TIGR02266 family)
MNGSLPHPHQGRESDPGNRRTSLRIDFETEISLTSDSQFFAGLTRNVSRGGVFVATFRQLPLGSSVTMQLTLPEGVLVAHGIVRWRREQGPDTPAGLGIAFEGLDDEAKRTVERFIEQRDPLYHDDGE